MGQAITVVVFDRDLRLADHEALAAGSERGVVVPVYLRDVSKGGQTAGDVWLHHALVDLDAQLRERGSRLIVRGRGELEAVVRETGAGAVFWSRRYDPAGRAEDAEREMMLRGAGVEGRMFGGTLMFEPGEVMTGGGTPYRVFTAFYRECMKRHVVGAGGEVEMRSPRRWPVSMKVGELRLVPGHEWAERMMGHWQAGRRGGMARLAEFVKDAVGGYAEMRDRVDVEGVSRMSPYLAWGQVGVREVWGSVMRARGGNGYGDGDGEDGPAEAGRARGKGAGRADEGGAGRADEGGAGRALRGCDAFLRQLVWREFAYQLLWHYPKTVSEPLDGRFAKFAWVEDAGALRKWQRGETGYGIVDAGMRQLWETGWMHNRARMITASFLTKDLRMHWRHGAAWFMRTLVDGDAANNTMGWQWVAGCGADAQPYFRVFNPTLQAEKFDPRQAYVGKWAGERRIEPMVDHGQARDGALAAYAEMKSRMKREG